MGLISNLFGGGRSSEEELGEIARRSAERARKKGRPSLWQRLVGRSDPQYHRELGEKIRSDWRTQYHQHEQQMREEERVHQTTTRPRYLYELEQSFRVPYYKGEVERLKRENSPYAAHTEDQLKYAQQSVDKYMYTYDHEYERQKYDKKYAFKQQQEDYAKQVHGQADKQKEQVLDQMKRREAQQQAMYSGSNVSRGGGRGGQPLGRGQKFSSFNPVKARGSFGRSRPSFTKPGK